jgi:adenylate cyclase
MLRTQQGGVMQRREEARADLELRLLGRFSLRRGDQPIALHGQRPRALLAFLACSAGTPYARERLLGLLWGDRFEEQARQSLRQTLSALRKVLGPAVIDADRDQVRLKESFASDVSRFLALVSGSDRDRLHEAVELYQDDLLAGFSLEETAFTEWLMGERARLRDLLLRALDTLMEHNGAEPEQLLAYARRAVALDPYRERAHRQLLRALAATGRRGDALSHYRELERRLHSDLGVDPEAATREVFEAVRRGAIGPSPPPPSTVDAVSTASAKTRSAGKPSIVVRPFANMSGDPQQDYFSRGVTEDIVTELSRFRQISVLARGATVHEPGARLDAGDVGREIGAHYVLEGSARRMGDRVRITAQLVDSRSGDHLWAERFDRDQDDIFAVQDQVVRTIVGTLVGRLEAAEVEQLRRRPTTSLEAYECVLRGRALPLGDVAIEAEKRMLYERAIALDPDYGRAHALLSHAFFLEWFRDMGGSDVALDHALELAKKAVALDETDPLCQSALGWIYLFRKSFDLADQYYQRALRLNPNNSEHIARMSFLYAYTGRPDEALDSLAQARLIDPFFSSVWYWHHLGYAHFIARHYDEAIAAFSHSTTMPFWVQAYLAACYALTDRGEHARPLVAEVLRLVPDFSVARLTEKEPFQRPADRQHLVDGLRRAGLPE